MVFTCDTHHMEDIYKIAALATPIATGSYRVVVCDADASLKLRDFSALPEAQAYANDVASESGDVPLLAYVYDSGYERIYTGRPYYAK